MTHHLQGNAQQLSPEQRVVEIAARFEANSDRLLSRMDAHAYGEGPQLVTQLYTDLVAIRSVLDELIQTPDQNRWADFPLSQPCDKTGSFWGGVIVGVIGALIYAGTQARP